MSEQLASLHKKGGGDLKETVLWTNPSPTSSFNAQTITLSDDMNNYQFLKVVSRISKTDSTERVYEIEPSKFYDMCIRGTISGVSWIRIISKQSDTTVSSSTSYRVNASGTSTDNAIPVQISGLKL